MTHSVQKVYYQVSKTLLSNADNFLSSAENVLSSAENVVCLLFINFLKKSHKICNKVYNDTPYIKS